MKTSTAAGVAAASAVAGAVVVVVITGWDPLTPSQPPIKVRGGAMTFRYAADNQNHKTQWFDYSSGSKTGVCAQLDTTGGLAKLKVFQEPDPQDLPTSRVADLSGNWVVDLHGRNSSFASDNAEGVELKPVPDCNGKKGVSVLPIPNSQHSQFYPNELSSTDGKSFARRYHTINPDCSSDLDVCEHLGKIYLNPPAGPITDSTPAFADCANGECLLVIVNSLF